MRVHLSFADLLLAKALAEDNIVAIPTLKQLLHEIDRSGERLSPRLMRGNLLPGGAQQLAQAQSKIKTYLFMMQEAIFTEIVKKSGRIPKEALRRMQGFQKREGYKRRLASILHQAGYINEAAMQGLAGKIERKLNKHQEAIIKQYRSSDYEGLSRPLTKKSKSGTSVKMGIPSTSAQRTGVHPAKSNPAIPVADQPPPPRVRRQTMALSVPLVEESEDDYEGVVLDDRYKLERKVGQGAMGMVYLARDLELPDRPVAIKLVIDENAAEEAVDRFKREILATSFFDHDNVVQIYDAGELQDGTHYMAMEYVRGEELRDLLKREKKLSPARALNLIEQLLEGMAASHSASVVHRDLKPENLMITDRGGREFLKIMDFGIARILDAEEFQDQIFLSMAGQVSGSPAYLAPESISGDRIDGRTDIYAVGIIFCELLTGQLPVGGKTVASFISGHLYKKHVPLAELDPKGDYPAAYQTFVDKLLQKKPDDRFQSCEEALSFFRQHLKQEEPTTDSAYDDDVGWEVDLD